MKIKRKFPLTLLFGATTIIKLQQSKLLLLNARSNSIEKRNFYNLTLNRFRSEASHFFVGVFNGVSAVEIGYLNNVFSFEFNNLKVQSNVDQL
jgi:hypothetical protein